VPNAVNVGVVRVVALNVAPLSALLRPVIQPFFQLVGFALRLLGFCALG